MRTAAPADLVPLLGAGLVAYVVVVVAAIALCTAARERGRQAREVSAAPPEPGDAPGVDRTPEGVVAYAAALLQADAALFGWDLRTDGLCLLAATRASIASGEEGRHLAREAVMAGSCARPPALDPVAIAVPAERHDVRLGALCVSRDAGPPLTARERGVLLRLGALAADVLGEHAHPPAPVRRVPA